MARVRNGNIGVVLGVGLLLAAPPVQAEALPTADSLFERYQEAAGLTALEQEPANLLARGTIELPDVLLEGPIEVAHRPPNGFLRRFNLEGVGDFEDGFVGELGWQLNPIEGSRLSTDDEIVNTKHLVDYRFDQNFRHHFPERRTIAATIFDGQEVYQVEATTPEGILHTLYFSKESGFVVGTTRKEFDLATGWFDLTVILRDRKDFGGLQIATFIEHRGLVLIQMHIEEVIFNATDFPRIEVPAHLLPTPPAVRDEPRVISTCGHSRLMRSDSLDMVVFSLLGLSLVVLLGLTVRARRLRSPLPPSGGWLPAAAPDSPLRRSRRSFNTSYVATMAVVGVWFGAGAALVSATSAVDSAFFYLMPFVGSLVLIGLVWRAAMSGVSRVRTELGALLEPAERAIYTGFLSSEQHARVWRWWGSENVGFTHIAADRLGFSFAESERVIPRDAVTNLTLVPQIAKPGLVWVLLAFTDDDGEARSILVESLDGTNGKELRAATVALHDQLVNWFADPIVKEMGLLTAMTDE